MSTLIDKQKIEFNNYLVDFIEYMYENPCLSKKYQREFKKYGKYYMSFTDRMDFISSFSKQMSTYAHEISIQYDGMFSDDDPKFSGKRINILYGIDFKSMWKECQSTLTPEFKTRLWKDLKTLYVFSSHIIRSIDEFNSVVTKHKTIINKMIQSLNESNRIKEETDRQIELEKLEEEATKIDFKQLFDIFGEDNNITSIIVEIAKELNFSETFSGMGDPLAAFSSIFGGGEAGGKLNDIMEKISDKIKSKMVQKGITPEQLLEDAKKLQERLFDKFKGMTGMPGMEDIGIKIADYFKDMDFSSQAEGGSESDQSTGTGMPNINIEEIQKQFEKFREQMAEFDPNGTVNLSELIKDQ